MATKYGTPMKEIGSALSISPRKAEVMLRAFEATLEYGRTNTDIERKWIHKFSYFYELFRDKSLRSWASNPENLRTFSSLISGINPKLALGNQVRRLAVILMDPQAFSILQSEGFDKAYDRVNRRKSRNDPDGKLLEAFETMVKISNGSIRLTRKRIDVLLDIKLCVHQILSKDPKP
jgi:hypothetical protein